MRPSALIAAFLLLCFPVCSRASEGHIVKAQGFGSIINGDEAQACREAVVYARVNALESIKVPVYSDRFLMNNALILDQVRVKTQGYIRTEKIIAQRIDHEINDCEVTLEAWIDTQLTPEVAARLRRKQVVVVDVPVLVHHLDGSTTEHPRRTLQERLKAQLSDQGFHVYTLQDLHAVQAILDSLGIEAPSNHQDLGRLVMAGILVHGQVEVWEEASKLTRNLSFFRAEPSITASDLSIPPSTIATSPDTDGFKAGHSNPRRAIGMALREATQPTTDHLLPRLLKYAERETVTVSLQVEGVPDMSKYQLLTRLLRRLIGVARVEADQHFTSGGQARFRIHYKEQLDMLHSLLHRLPGLQVERFDNLFVEARFTGF